MKQIKLISCSVEDYFNKKCNDLIKEGYSPMFAPQVTPIVSDQPGYLKSEYFLIYTQQWVKND